MVHASYTCDSVVYTVKFITTTDYIMEDMLEVSEHIIDTDPDIYRIYMMDSVAQGLAYDIWRDGVRVGFVYNRMEGVKYMGASIHITDSIAMLIALKTMFEIKDVHKISFFPHKSNLKYFKSMARGCDIRTYHTTGKPLPILRENMEANGRKLFSYLGIEAV